MHNYIKKIVLKYFPVLGRPKRFMVAWMDSIKPTRQSYSQYGEDREFLALYNLSGRPGDIYVDIGANHPTTISNTYLLYRHGVNGILIEPNYELASLCSKFRPNDIVIPIGCDNKSGIFMYNVSSTPVLSSFVHANADCAVYKSYYVPVLTLDQIMEPFSEDIFLLSIDVEGLSVEVLQGACNTLRRCKYLCIEVANNSEEKKYTHLLIIYLYCIKKLVVISCFKEILSDCAIELYYTSIVFSNLMSLNLGFFTDSRRHIRGLPSNIGTNNNNIIIQ